MHPPPTPPPLLLKVPEFCFHKMCMNHTLRVTARDLNCGKRYETRKVREPYIRVEHAQLQLSQVGTAV